MRIEELPQDSCLFEGEPKIIGRSAGMVDVLRQVEIVAPTNATVLILGETGAGKELIAHAIHRLSSSSKGPLVKMNCAAIPATLLESELFGHEKGSFTGAIMRKIGRFEQAHQGTLFLDEIADIPADLQSKLLRVLQEREFERIGGLQTQRVNVRVIAATSRDLPAMILEQEFRSDLYYRLNVFPIRLPALRERVEDIPVLTWHFVRRFADEMNKRIQTIANETMAALTSYEWPGNIRELQNFMERAVILTSSGILNAPVNELKAIVPEDYAFDTVRARHGSSTLEDCQREHILRTLHDTGWLVGGPNGAARLLGVKRTTLISKMQKLGIVRQRRENLRAAFPARFENPLSPVA